MEVFNLISDNLNVGQMISTGKVIDASIWVVDSID